MKLVSKYSMSTFFPVPTGGAIIAEGAKGNDYPVVKLMPGSPMSISNLDEVPEHKFPKRCWKSKEPSK